MKAGKAREMFHIYSIMVLPWLLGFGFLGTLQAQPKQFNFSHLTAQDGLSSEKIRCLLQDQKGFIWIGTNDGLNRYDGTEIKVFQRVYGNPSSLSHNSISALYFSGTGVA